MLDVPPTRNYLRLAVAIRFAMTVLLLAAPTLFKSLWGIEVRLVARADAEARCPIAFSPFFFAHARASAC